MPHLMEAHPGHAAADASGGARGGSALAGQRGRRPSERRIARDRDHGRVGVVGVREGVGLKCGRLCDYVHAGQHT